MGNAVSGRLTLTINDSTLCKRGSKSSMDKNVSLSWETSHKERWGPTERERVGCVAAKSQHKSVTKRISRPWSGSLYFNLNGLAVPPSPEFITLGVGCDPARSTCCPG